MIHHINADTILGMIIFVARFLDNRLSIVLDLYIGGIELNVLNYILRFVRL